MKNILHLSLFLAVVSAIAGGALAYANSVTAPIIEYNTEMAEKEILSEMYPDASLDDFEIVDVTVDNSTVNKIFKYGDVYIFNMTVSGFDGGTNYLVAINSTDDTIEKFQTISNGDTKGIGSKVTEPAFAESLEGKDANGQLDTISGATMSSGPIVEGIHEAALIVAELD
jgi:electron transport complex protein RnfG